jgi:hypothetical protein
MVMPGDIGLVKVAQTDVLGDASTFLVVSEISLNVHDVFFELITFPG